MAPCGWKSEARSDGCSQGGAGGSPVRVLPGSTALITQCPCRLLGLIQSKYCVFPDGSSMGTWRELGRNSKDKNERTGN